METSSRIPLCGRPGCKNEVSRRYPGNKGRTNKDPERRWNKYCGHECFTLDSATDVCPKGHERRKGKGRAYCPTCRRIGRFARHYGIDAETIEAFGVADACEICGQESEMLHLDHNHETNELRGWLCGGCNKGLGHFGDSPKTVTRALRYLMERGNYGKDSA